MKVLILGDGTLGSELKKQTGWDSISRKAGTFVITVINFIKKHYIKDYDIIVNCIANTDTYADDYDEHFDVNYLFVAHLSEACRDLNKKLVQISTEYVYANNLNIPTEENNAIPHDSYYALTKLLADEYVKLRNNSYLICRLLHKPNDFNYPEIWNTKTSGDKVNKIAELVIKLINNNAEGVYNVGTGSKYLSDLVPNCKIIEPPKHVPTDTRMNLNKLNTFLNNIT